MFEFLVSSQARRKLLLLLWRDRKSGSMSDLARQAKLAFASAHRELHAMRDHGLVVAVGDGKSVVYSANFQHAWANALQMAVAQTASSATDSKTTRAELQTLGAPLYGTPAPVDNIEATLVRGVTLAHQDATVASVMPVCFFCAADRLDPQRLRDEAVRADERQAVGFFLDLTGTLAKDGRLRLWSKNFQDERVSTQRPFFPERTVFSRKLAERNTPPVARRWGWRMNMGLDAFASMFEKHAHA